LEQHVRPPASKEVRRIEREHEGITEGKAKTAAEEEFVDDVDESDETRESEPAISTDGHAPFGDLDCKPTVGASRAPAQSNTGGSRPRWRTSYRHARRPSPRLSPQGASLSPWNHPLPTSSTVKKAPDEPEHR
jgi:hypothetical protein